MFRVRSGVVAVVALLVQINFGWGQNASAPSATSAAAQAAAQPSVTGTIAYRERMALPPDAAIEVKLQEISAQHTPAKTVAETVFSPEGKQAPIPFQLSYNPADVKPANTYQVEANISVNGKVMFVTNTAYPVLTNGAPSQVAVMLQQAPAAPSAASGTKLYGTHWVLAELNGKPAEPGAGKSAHLVLHKKGKLSGFTGCNNLMGTYIAEQGALQFTPSATTMKMCPQNLMAQEQAFLAALKATNKYQVSGNTLELMNGDQALAKFEGEAKQ
jgi:putative lipoprotein